MQSVLKQFLLSFCVATLSVAAGCSSDASSDDDASAGTGGTAGTSATGDVQVMPDSTGWVDREAAWNTIGIQGAWYPYGDQYGTGPSDAKCIHIGMHSPTECSTITMPDPLALAFPNVNGDMCTAGETAIILDCPAGLNTSGCPMDDYSNMWGAGIGLDVNADKGEDGGAKNTWDPAAQGVIGISFEIDNVPLPGLRVEIPMRLTDTEAAMVNLPPGSITDDHPDGAPYWGATSSYPASPVAMGVNRVLWTDIKPPRTNYVFDKARMLGVQFHVPAVPGTSTSRGAYSFCIKKLTFLKQ